MQVVDKLSFSTRQYAIMPLEDALRDLQTGDVLFLHGCESSSRVIQMASRSFWSHCGLIVRGPLPRQVRIAYEMGTWLSWLRYYQLRHKTLPAGEEDKVGRVHVESVQSEGPVDRKYDRDKVNDAEKGSHKRKKNKKKRGKKKKRVGENLRTTEEQTEVQGGEGDSSSGWDDDVYIFESDVVTVDKRKGGGVQLIPLLCWMNGYSDHYRTTQIYVMVKRLFINDARPTKTFEDYPGLEELFLEVCENTFDRDIRNLARSIPKLNKSKPEQTDSIFCSELVVRCYQVMELLPASVIAKNYAPKDFLKESFQLLGGASLDKGYRIVLPDAAWKGPPAYDDALYSRFNVED